MGANTCPLSLCHSQQYYFFYRISGRFIIHIDAVSRTQSHHIYFVITINNANFCELFYLLKLLLFGILNYFLLL